MCPWMCLIGLNCSGYCIFLGNLTSDSGLNGSFIKSQPTSPSKLGWIKTFVGELMPFSTTGGYVLHSIERKCDLGFFCYIFEKLSCLNSFYSCMVKIVFNVTAHIECLINLIPEILIIMTSLNWIIFFSYCLSDM